MGKVLIINDDDGHAHAIDISTPEKRKVVMFSMVNDFLKSGTSNISAVQADNRYGKVLTAAMASGDVEQLLKAIRECDDLPQFDRCGGCKLYEVEVEESWPAGLSRKFS